MITATTHQLIVIWNSVKIHENKLHSIFEFRDEMINYRMEIYKKERCKKLVLPSGYNEIETHYIVIKVNNNITAKTLLYCH